MKRYAKLLQMDERGQLVIPKDVRDELGISAGAGFACYALDSDAILLRPIKVPGLEEQSALTRELESTSAKTGIKNASIAKARERYKPKAARNFDEV